MATPEEDVYTALSGASGVTDLVSDRIYIDERKQDSAVPAIVYFRTQSNPVVTLSGSVIGNETTFGIFAIAESRAVAEQVASACKTALSVAPFAHLPATGHDYDDETDLHVSAVTVVHQA